MTPSVIISCTASVISLVVIIILNFIYQICAVKLTEIELPRTQQQFDDSYSLKVFCFQFVNYYSTLFYIAFFKDTMTGYPGDYTTIDIRGQKYRWAGCDGGCSYELAIQLIITMVGKQLFNNFIEIILPWVTRHYERWAKVNKVQNVEQNRLELFHSHSIFSEERFSVVDFKSFSERYPILKIRKVHKSKV